MRLQKFLADAGIGSRRKCEEYIREGRAYVNGAPAAIGCILQEGDVVEFDGRVIAPKEERITIMLNKPQGVVCTSSDPEGRRTAIDYVRALPYRLYCVGRLDYDSEGLVLLTNDGELAHRLTHPSFEVSKTYYVECSGRLSPQDIARLESGVMLEEGITAPAQVKNVKVKGNRTAFEITIHEGRNRQVRRMVAAVGRDTMLLRRIGEGGVMLGDLPLGSWRKLTDKELTLLEK